MYFAIVIFAVTALFLVAGALPCPDGDPALIFRTPVFIALLGTISILVLLCCWKRKASSIFLALHLGVVVILAGAFMTFLFGRTTQFNMPVMPAMLVDKIPAPNNTRWNLGFSFSVADFNVQYYKPDYTLFVPDNTKEGGFRKADTFSTEKNLSINLGAFGSIPVIRLIDDKTGSWIEKYTLENGCILARENAVPKDYEAKLRIVPKSGGEFTWSLKVNRPLSYNGWRIYLVSFGSERSPYVQLSAKKDSGRGAVIAGIWILMAGTFIGCLRRKGRFEDDKP